MPYFTYAPSPRIKMWQTYFNVTLAVDGSTIKVNNDQNKQLLC